MNLQTQAYVEQVARWPKKGRYVLAHFDAQTVVVYQAYKPSIAQYALTHGRFGGDFKYSRMSWIKPNFLWMMYRSNWAQAEGQESILGIRIRRGFFDQILSQAVPSTYHPALFPSPDDWKSAVAKSDVRLQWDPDHYPAGGKCERRAVQLGLRGDMLHRYGKSQIVEIIDMTPLALEQRTHIAHWKTGQLITPVEHVYTPSVPTPYLRLETPSEGE